MPIQQSALETWDSRWNHHVMFDVYDPDGHKIIMLEMVPITTPETTL